MAGDLSIIRNELDSYKCCGNDAVHFKLVRQESDIQNEKTTFKPEMTHQLFGDAESIFGYKDLQVQVYYTAGRLATYLNLKYTDKIDPEKNDGISADNVLQTIANEMPPGYFTNIDDFLNSLQKENTFKPFGELEHSYKIITKENEEKNFEIYKTGVDASGFSDYHTRLQTFILFYIDAASYLDIDDDRWTFYLLYEKYKRDGDTHYAICGYLTAYNYYAYPAKIRPRISQVLVLPPFQKQGHGAQLLQTFYDDMCKRTDVMDITVEDPSEDFQRLRDFVDAKNCSKLATFQPDCLLNGLTEGMNSEAQTKLKLSRRQTRRIYEILRLKATNRSDTSGYESYRLDIKSRLNAPFRKNGRDFQKLKHALSDVELSQTLNLMTLEQRHAYLETMFEKHVEVYQRIIERIAAS